MHAIQVNRRVLRAYIRVRRANDNQKRKEAILNNLEPMNIQRSANLKLGSRGRMIRVRDD
jgi:hypothetical protein